VQDKIEQVMDGFTTGELKSGKDAMVIKQQVANVNRV
jgi:hypothetical protein